MTRRRQSGVRLDQARLERELLRLGMTMSGFAARETDLDRRTVAKAFKGKPVSIASAMQIASAFGYDDLRHLMASPCDDSRPNDNAPLLNDEWEIASHLSGWIEASNGLQFRLCRMRHRYVPGRLGRGKQYDLLNPSTRERERLTDYLTRHAAVSERVHGAPEIAETLNVFPSQDQDTWWVIDRWVDGKSLDAILQIGPLDRSILPVVMKSILHGLETLHRHDIVFRELAPRRVIVEQSDGRVILTDFELGKLLDNAPSVSESTWPDDPYRAPEIEGGQVDETADLYSWARILAHAVSGNLPDRGQDIDAVTIAGLPKAVWKSAVDCLAPSPTQRPKTAAHVLHQIRNWK